MKYKITAAKESLDPSPTLKFFNELSKAEEWISNEVDLRTEPIRMAGVCTNKEIEEEREIERSLITLESIPDESYGPVHEEYNFTDDFGDYKAALDAYNDIDIPMNFLDRKTETLIILIEECGEVIQESCKLIRFPQNDVSKLTKELGDLQCMINLTAQHLGIGTMAIGSQVNKKREKLKEFSSLID